MGKRLKTGYERKGCAACSGGQEQQSWGGGAGGQCHAAACGDVTQ